MKAPFPKEVVAVKEWAGCKKKKKDKVVQFT